MRPKRLTHAQKLDELSKLIPDNQGLIDFAICFPEPLDYLEEIKEVYDVQDIKDFPLLLLKAGVNLDDRQHLQSLRISVNSLFFSDHNGFLTQFMGVFSAFDTSYGHFTQYLYPNRIIAVLHEEKVLPGIIDSILDDLYKKVPSCYYKTYEYTEYVKKPLELYELKEAYYVQDIKDFPDFFQMAYLNLENAIHCQYIQNAVNKCMYNNQQNDCNQFTTQVNFVFANAGITDINTVSKYVKRYAFPGALISALHEDKVPVVNIDNILDGLYKKVPHWYYKTYEYTEYVKKPLESQSKPDTSQFMTLKNVIIQQTQKQAGLIPNNHELIDFVLSFPDPLDHLEELKAAYDIQDIKDFPRLLIKAGIEFDDFGDCLYIQNAVNNYMYNNQQNDCNQFTTQVNLVFANAGITDINTITAYIQLYAFPDKLISTLHEDKIPVGNIKQVLKGLYGDTPYWYLESDQYINYVQKPLELQ